MNKRHTALSMLAALVVLACTFAGTAFAQYEVNLATQPRFVTLPQHPQTIKDPAAAQLTQWNGSFTDLTNKKITYTMVGTDPATTNGTTNIPTIVIPLKMVYGSTNGNMTFDPQTAKLPNGQTIIQNVGSSPIFRPGIDFNQGGVDLGNTQYIDAFQRGNFWSSVSTNSKYHVLLSPIKIAPEQTITVPKADGSVQVECFSATICVTAGTADINFFDAQLQTIMAKFHQIQPNTVPIFITYDVYLTEFGGCCIGGYHSANGPQPGGQTYNFATSVDVVGAFSQDVSALSHEIGEWMDDPFVDNNVNCLDNSILEVGDPLETESNYGGFPYTLHGFTYNLQSLVFLGYFGAPPSTSVNSWLSFQNDEKHVCPGQ